MAFELPECLDVIQMRLFNLCAQETLEMLQL